MSNYIQVDPNYLAALEYEVRKLLREKYRSTSGRNVRRFIIGDNTISYVDCSNPAQPAIAPQLFTIDVNMNKI